MTTQQQNLTRVKAMEPGIYHDVPFADYLTIDAVSNSRLSLLAKSPKHYRESPPLEKTKPLVLGSLVHAGRLEPMSIAEQYAVMPDYHLDDDNVTTGGQQSNSKTTKYVKDRVAEFVAANDGKEVVDREWYQEATQLVTSLHNDADANKLFNAFGAVEVTMVWDDPETGIRCKGRIDKMCPTIGAFADLKTTPELESFPRSFARYSYHRQMAFYQAGYAVLNGELLTPWIVAIEKQPPYCVQSAPVHELDIEQGAQEFAELLEKLASCRELDEWPGPESPDSWELPAWARIEGKRYVETESEIIAI